eukprot:3324353-Rhodomonas_salina.2
MCAEKCPVNINTGRMVKDLRAKYGGPAISLCAPYAEPGTDVACCPTRMTAPDSASSRAASVFSNNFGLVCSCADRRAHPPPRGLGTLTLCL